MNRLLLIVLLFSTAIYCQTCSARSSVSRCSNGPPNDIPCFSISDCDVSAIQDACLVVLPCFNATSCTNNFCVWAQRPNGTIDSFCSDGNPCNGVESICGSTACSCLPASPACPGQCQTCTPQGNNAICGVNVSISCNDGQWCTIGDTCRSDGSCRGTPRCANQTACKTCCNETSQLCSCPDGTSCDDGSFCNGPDVCTSETCVHGPAPVCNTLCNSQCNDLLGNCFSPNTTDCGTTTCVEKMCNGLGSCQVKNLDGHVCSDSNACTQNDTCSGGVCTGGFNNCTCSSNGQCDDLNPCTFDYCSLGACHNVGNLTTTCNDGNFCNGNDTCWLGLCQNHTGDPCLSNPNRCKNQCNADLQQCLSPYATPCPDNDWCNGDEFCNGNGTCISSTARCIGLDVCKSCNNATRTCASPSGTVCQTSNWCDGVQRCDGNGSCITGAPPCNTSNPCTRACNSTGTAVGNCYERDCDDGQYCNGVEICLAGQCIAVGLPCANSPFCMQNCSEASRKCLAYSYGHPAPVCTNNNFCDGAEVCNGNGTCTSPGDPCTSTIVDAGCQSVCVASLSLCRTNCDNQHLSSTLLGGANQTTIIIGSVVGAVVLIIIIIIVILIVRSRRNVKQQDNAHELQVKVDVPEVKDVKIGEQLGGGNFGEVFYGVWHGETPVALKRLKNDDHLEAFIKEAKTLRDLNHPNIVRMLGIYTSPDTSARYIVTEFMSKGSLLGTLKAEKIDIKQADQLKMCAQCAAGMVYLSAKKIIHRDLAARNVLVTKTDNRYVCKISDFGLSRLTETNDYYKSTSVEVPVKWSAPEVLKFGTYTTKSDVWSFGVLCWEIFEYGTMPFAHLANKQTVEAVNAGERLPKPSNCPQKMYDLLLRCWSKVAADRPEFPEILQAIQDIYNETVPESERQAAPLVLAVEQDADLYNNESVYHNK